MGAVRGRGRGRGREKHGRIRDGQRDHGPRRRGVGRILDGHGRPQPWVPAIDEHGRGHVTLAAP